MSTLKKIVILGLFIVVLFFWQIRTWIYQPQMIPQETFVYIPKGSGTSAVAQTLVEADVLKKAWLFKLAARIFGLEKQLKAGEYVFQGPVSIENIIQKMAAGDIVHHKITFAEGLTTAQILKLIDEEPLLSGEISLTVKEGDLLPETYLFVRGDTKDSLIKQSMAAMQQTLGEAWQQRDPSLPLKNVHELLILASIIEKETGVATERGLVASVFVNRLNKGMKLQTDPTVIYALTLGQKELERPLTRKDLMIDSPYNTYIRYGLPPAPICNPGKASISAASRPEFSPFLYFVANGSGGHNFATSLNEHNLNVQNWKALQK